MRRWRRRKPRAGAVTSSIEVDASAVMASMHQAAEDLRRIRYRSRIFRERSAARNHLYALLEQTCADYGWDPNDVLAYPSPRKASA